jgi:hypothetical protein
MNEQNKEWYKNLIIYSMQENVKLEISKAHLKWLIYGVLILRQPFYAFEYWMKIILPTMFKPA